MDDRDYWTFVEMYNKFKDDNHTPKKNKRRSQFKAVMGRRAVNTRRL